MQGSKERSKQRRTCVGCGETTAPEEMVRLVLGEDGQVVPDLGQTAFGRGAWAHATPACLAKAAPRGLSRSFQREIRTSAEELCDSLRATAERRVISLLLIARRAGRLAVGASATEEQVKAGRARLFIVATDARSAADKPWITDAVREGRALAWSSKEQLGEALGRTEVGVLSVLDDGLSKAVAKAIALAQLARPASGAGKAPRAASTEAR